MTLTLQDMINNGILDEFAKCFNSKPEVRIVLISAGFPQGAIPNFDRAESPREFWLIIFTDIANGRMPGGFWTLLQAAAQQLPDNHIFKAFVIHQPAQPTRPQTVLGQAFDVFFSYSSNDRQIVKQVAEAVSQRGIKIWLDEWVIPTGGNFTREIQDVLETVKVVTVFYGINGYGPWQGAEVEIALERQVRGQCLIIPVILPGVKISDLPAFLKRLNAVRINNPLHISAGIDPVIDQLASTIQAHNQ